MFDQGKRHRSRAPALLALLALLSSAAVARAADEVGPDETGDGWRKVIAYGRCAFAVFSAVTPAQWTAAFFDCSRTFLDEPPIGVGGV